MSPPHPYRLPNGLRVVVVPDRWVPLVSVLVRYDVGSVHDPPGLRGLAHLVEHLSFDCGGHLDEGSLWPHFHRISAIGVNAFTSPWDTDYVETVPSVDLETVLWLESERMGFFRKPKPARMADEIDIVLAEKHWHHTDENRRIIYPLYEAVFPAPHPYAQVAPSDEIASATVDDLEQFVDAYMGPGNATLVLVGDVPSDVEGLIEKYFSDFEGGSRPPDPAHLDVTLTSEQRVQRPAAAGSGPELRVAWRLPPDLSEHELASLVVLLNSLDIPDADELESLDGTLFGGPRHDEAVVLTAGLAGSDAQAALRAITGALDRIRQNGLLADQVERARRRIVAAHLEALETYEARASRIADRIRRDGTADLDTWQRAVVSVEPPDVQALAARTFGPRRVVMATGVQR